MRFMTMVSAVALLTVMLAGCAQLSNDPDGDGLPNDAESTFGTDPNDPDTDGDGLTDYDEAVTYNTPTGGPDPLSPDTDGDGLSDHEEIILYGTPADRADDDRDGLTDHDEIRTYGVWSCAGDQAEPPRCQREMGPDPLTLDTDDDSWPDGDEIDYWMNRTGDPILAGNRSSTTDSDGDGFDDGVDGDPAHDLRVQVQIPWVNLTTAFEDGGANLTVSIFIGGRQQAIHVGQIETGRTDLSVRLTRNVDDGPSRPGTLKVATSSSWRHDVDGADEPVAVDGNQSVIVAPLFNAGDHTDDRFSTTSEGDDARVRYVVRACRGPC